MCIGRSSRILPILLFIYYETLEVMCFGKMCNKLRVDGHAIDTILDVWFISWPSLVINDLPSFLYSYS